MDLRFVTAEPCRERFEALEAERLAMGLSVARLCRRADVSEATYHKLIASKDRTPNFRTINKLRAALVEFDATNFTPPCSFPTGRPWPSD